MIGIVKISLFFALMISTAAIYAAQPWDDSSGWGDGGWVDEGAGSWDGDWSGADTGSWDSGSGGGDGNIGSSSNDYGGSNSWGSPIPAEMTSSDEAVFPSSISESSSTLIEEDSAQYAKRDIAYSMAAGGSSRNIFWIVSRDGSQNWRSVNIPCNRYARLSFIPSDSGQLIMEELYPNNQVRTYYYGTVVAFRQYRAWFFADTSGTHRMRYKIDNGPYSDTLTFYVGNCGGGGSGGICPCCGRPY